MLPPHPETTPTKTSAAARAFTRRDLPRSSVRSESPPRAVTSGRLSSPPWEIVEDVRLGRYSQNSLSRGPHGDTDSAGRHRFDGFRTGVYAARGHVHNRPAEAGVSLGGAGDGANATGVLSSLEGGVGGTPLNALQALMLRYPGPKAGGGGGLPFFRGGGPQSNSPGGGSLVVLARGPIVLNAGNILADTLAAGTAGSGGGAGGVVVLASQTSIGGGGGIVVAGANGNAGTNCLGAGGGGGGGIAHLYSPVITYTGTVSLGGGLPGAPGANNCIDAMAGGGGGACGGAGGSGASIPGAVHTAATAGAAGLSLQTLADPTPVF